MTDNSREPILWDWKSGFGLYFGKFYESLSHPTKNCLNQLEDLWKLVYEYQYERAIQPGFYAPTVNGQTPMLDESLQYFVIYQNVSKTQYYLHAVKLPTEKLLTHVSANDPKIIITPPSLVQGALGFTFGFYQFKVTKQKKRLIGYLSWCGKYLHMQPQESQVAFYMHCPDLVEFSREVDYE
jgi:hypothetical protein